MKIFICSSKAFYKDIPEIKSGLETMGHTVILPNSFNDPEAESRFKLEGKESHAKWKGDKFRLSMSKIQTADAMLVLNFTKNDIDNYIGGATFLEMYEMWKAGKGLFLYNPIPEGMLYDEICAFSPVILEGDIQKVKYE